MKKKIIISILILLSIVNFYNLLGLLNIFFIIDNKYFEYIVISINEMNFVFSLIILSTTSLLSNFICYLLIIIYMKSNEFKLIRKFQSINFVVSACIFGVTLFRFFYFFVNP